MLNKELLTVGSTVENLGSKRMVLYILIGREMIYGLSALNDFESFGGFFTYKDMQENDYVNVVIEWKVENLKEGDKYWTPNVLRSEEHEWCNSEIDRVRSRLGIIFQTKELAEAKRFELIK